MRNIVLIALAVFACNASAQNKGKIEMGFGAGLNMASVSDENYNSDTHYGFNLTASADYYFSDQWSMKIKLIYDQKGWDNGIIYDIETGDGFPTDFQVNYLTIPIMASWHFAPKRNWYLHFGPYVGILTGATAKRFDIDVKDNFNSTDFGIAVGVGVKIPVNDKIRFYVEYDGQGGFTDIIAQNYSSSVTTARSSINVGINFLAN